MSDAFEVEATAEQLRATALALRSELSRVIVGQAAVIEGALAALFAGGHVLLEGVPGLGKTLLVKTLGRASGLEMSRIQFTPDLMPADVLGTETLVETASGPSLIFKKGPIFAQLVLADEINRANPRSQAALLEAMAERQVTRGRQTHRLGPPFLVMATQNPVDMDGTYPLPEAQADRFLLKLKVPVPDREALFDILDIAPRGSLEAVKVVTDSQTLVRCIEHTARIPASDDVKRQIVSWICKTRPEEAPPRFRPFIRLGASPRGAQALLAAARARAAMAGRLNVSIDDARTVAHGALRHRILLNFAARSEGIQTDAIIEAILG